MLSQIGSADTAPADLSFIKQPITTGTMGSACSKSDAVEDTPPHAKYGTIGVMFDRFDKERKGFISLKNLKDMMKDDKTHFQGRDADHIMSKYGHDDQMSIDEFKQWWTSTYTTMVCFMI